MLVQVVCAAYTDEEFKQHRAPPDVFEERYAKFGIHKVWRCVHLHNKFARELRMKCPGKQTHNCFSKDFKACKLLVSITTHGRRTHS